MCLPVRVYPVTSNLSRRSSSGDELASHGTTLLEWVRLIQAGVHRDMNQLRSASSSESTFLDRRRALDSLVRGALPTLADFCFVYVEAGRSISCIACGHVSSGGARLVRALTRSYAIRVSDPASAVAQVFRTGRPLLRTGIHLDRSGVDDTSGGVADLHRRLAARSALVVPIEISGKVRGALSLCYSQSGRSYGARELVAARRLASGIARALGVPRVRDGSFRLPAAARHPGQGTPIRRRVASRN